LNTLLFRGCVSVFNIYILYNIRVLNTKHSKMILLNFIFTFLIFEKKSLKYRFFIEIKNYKIKVILIYRWIDLIYINFLKNSLTYIHKLYFNLNY